MNQQIFEVPIELITHGHVKVKATDYETAKRTISNWRSKDLRKYFKESFTFARVAERHVVENEIHGDLEKTNGAQDNDHLSSDSGTQGPKEGLSKTPEEDGPCGQD